MGGCLSSPPAPTVAPRELACSPSTRSVPFAFALPGIQPAVFAFPCATLITMMLAFIMYMTLRNATHQKDMVEVGAQQGGGWAPGPREGEDGAGLCGEDLGARPQGVGGVYTPAPGVQTCPRGTCKPGKVAESAPSHLTYPLCSPLAWQLGP